MVVERCIAMWVYMGVLYKPLLSQITEILDCAEMDEDAQLNTFSASSVVKLVLRNYTDVSVI